MYVIGPAQTIAQLSVLSFPRADLRGRGLEESSESLLQSPFLILLIYFSSLGILYTIFRSYILPFPSSSQTSPLSLSAQLHGFFFFLTHQVQFVLSMQSWVCDLLLKHDPHTRGYTLKLTCPLRGHLQEFSGSC